MAANLEAVMLDAKNYADKVRHSLPVEKIYLFGSYAKGTATELSDVDIAVFFTDFQEKTRFDFELSLLKLCRGHHSYFEPLAFESADLYDDNPFVNEILRTGLEI